MIQRRAALPALLLAFMIGFAPTLRAQDGAKREAPPQGGQHRTLLPADSTTEHEITIGGRKLAYSATAGTLDLRNEQGEATAEIFYVSFTLKQPAPAQQRPVTYLFNGGPGASAAYLDIGAIGPRALAVGSDGAVPKSETVIDNADTWLPFTDLVFIDPAGTGWSRATDEDKAPKEFWGVSQDLDALADMIRLHLTKSGRLTSPVYLVGESYGGFRAARLARDLATDHGIELAGVVMISPVIEFGLMFSNPLDPLSWALRLPSYAAVHMGEKSLEPGALADVEQFALHDYLVALAAGPRDGTEATAIYQKLAQLTGLDEERIAGWHGRIPLDAYVRDVRRSDGRVVSRYDASVSDIDPNPWGEEGGDDPVLDGSVAPFTGAFIAYAARRARLQDGAALRAAEPRGEPPLGLGWPRRAAHAGRQRRSAPRAGARAAAQGDDRARCRRPSDALHDEPLCEGPHAGRARRPDRAQALCRWPHALSSRAIAPPPPRRRRRVLRCRRELSAGTPNSPRRPLPALASLSL